MAHYLVLTQQVATSTTASQEPSVTDEATTTAVDATTTAVDGPQAEPAQVPCDQQPCDPPQESVAAEAQGAQLASSGLTTTCSWLDHINTAYMPSRPSFVCPVHLVIWSPALEKPSLHGV